MKDKTRKILGTPETSFHKRTLAYIEPLLTEMNEEDIEGKKLTLEGCWKSCHQKGRKLAKDGCADISEEQERTWVREYFGIEGAAEAVPPKEPLKLSGENAPRLDFDLDSLFD